MQIRLLEDIITKVGGEEARKIIKIMEGKKEISEFIIAKKLNLNVNQVRNIFYKLLNNGLVSFNKKKDKRKNWYTYYWSLNKEKCLEFLEKELKKEIDELKNKLKNREEKRFYYCKTCKIEVGEEKALINDFTCYECGNVYELSDNEKIINELKNEIEKKEKQVKLIEEELKIFKEKIKKKIELKKKRAKTKKRKGKKKKIKKINKKRKIKKSKKK